MRELLNSPRQPAGSIMGSGSGSGVVGFPGGDGLFVHLKCCNTFIYSFIFYKNNNNNLLVHSICMGPSTVHHIALDLDTHPDYLYFSDSVLVSRESSIQH